MRVAPHPPGRRGRRIGAPTPSERSVRISRTTLFRILFTVQKIRCQILVSDHILPCYFTLRIWGRVSIWVRMGLTSVANSYRDFYKKGISLFTFEQKWYLCQLVPKADKSWRRRTIHDLRETAHDGQGQIKKVQGWGFKVNEKKLFKISK